jgi:hypothetical protein
VANQPGASYAEGVFSQLTDRAADMYLDRVTKPVSRIGWMIIEKGFGGHDREGDLRRGIHDTLDAIKAAAESTQNLPPHTRTSHRINRSVCATHIPAGTGIGIRSACGTLTLVHSGGRGAVFDAVHPSFVNRPCRTTITVWSTRAGRFVSLLADRAVPVPADLIVRVINRPCRRRRR